MWSLRSSSSVAIFSPWVNPLVFSPLRVISLFFFPICWLCKKGLQKFSLWGYLYDSFCRLGPLCICLVLYLWTCHFYEIEDSIYVHPFLCWNLVLLEVYQVEDLLFRAFITWKANFRIFLRQRLQQAAWHPFLGRENNLGNVCGLEEHFQHHHKGFWDFQPSLGGLF